MITWILILICLALGFFIIRISHLEKKIKLIIFLLVCVVLYFSVTGLLATEKVDLTSPRGVVNAVYLYFEWLGGAVKDLWNIGVETTGKVINIVKFNRTENTEQQTIKDGMSKIKKLIRPNSNFVCRLSSVG